MSWVKHDWEDARARDILLQCRRAMPGTAKLLVIERIMPEGNYFFHDVAGKACIDPSVLARRTDYYKNWVRQYTSERDIPALRASEGARKEDVVLPYYRRLEGESGVACILTSMERGRTFVSYTPRVLPKSGDANYRMISPCFKQFLHYYFYVFDRVMGPMSLCFNLPPLQRDLLSQRSLLHCPGTHSPGYRLPQRGQHLSGGCRHRGAASRG